MMGTVSRALPTPRRVRRAPRLTAVLAAAVLALSACSNSPLDHAATVNGRVISESELHEVITLLEASPVFEGQSVSPQVVLGLLVQLPALEQSIGGTLGDEEAARRARTQFQVEETTPLLLDLVRATAYLEGGAQATEEQLAQLDVEINPRYGKWDPEGLASGESSSAIAPDVPPWISTDEADS
jgi:hypothetical protein